MARAELRAAKFAAHPRAGIAVPAPAPTHRPGPRAASETPRDRPTGLGEQLKSERERRGLVLEHVSGLTKIRTGYLEALERNQWDALPADVFTRGYLRAYAECLGLDPEVTLRAYARERRIAAAGDPSAAASEQVDVTKAVLSRLAKTHGAEPSRRGSRTMWTAVGLLGSGILAVATWTVLQLGVFRADPRTAVEVPLPTAPPSNETPLENPPRETAASLTPDAIPGVESQAAASPVESRTPEMESAAAPPTDAPKPAPVESASRLEVAEAGVGTAVVDSQLVGRGERFEEGTQVHFWTRVLGGRPGDRIQHVWLRGGQAVASASLRVGGPNWRTQTQRRLREGSAGDWTVEARDPEGRVLVVASFQCVPAGVPAQ